jgi:hypothetical protein
MLLTQQILDGFSTANLMDAFQSVRPGSEDNIHIRKIKTFPETSCWHLLNSHQLECITWPYLVAGQSRRVSVARYIPSRTKSVSYKTIIG